MKSCTKLIGIVNITPDSFSDGFLSDEINRVLAHIDHLFASGAEMVDIGAESSNPQSRGISLAEEKVRLLPILGLIGNTFPRRIFSLDTRKPEIAIMFLESGGEIINDYAGLTNDDLIEVVKHFGCRYIVNHFPGQSVNEVHAKAKIDSFDQVKHDLLRRKEFLVNRGIEADKIVLDPGIGFAKSAELNWQSLAFKAAVPKEQVCIGYSRKRVLGAGRFGKEVNRKAGLIALKTSPDYIRLHEPQLLSKGEISDE